MDKPDDEVAQKLRKKIKKLEGSQSDPTKLQKLQKS
jgi:hypothetical protein